MFFYICFCLLVKCRTKHLIFILCTVQAINVYFLVYPPSGISLHWLFYINPIFRISDFIIGIVICRVFLAKPVNPKIGLCSAMEIGSLLFLALTIYAATNHVANMNVKYDLLYIPCMASVVIAFAFNGGIISRILANRYLILLGEASFSFYMFHWMIVSKLIEIMKPGKDNPTEVLIYILSCLVLAIVVSVLSFKLVEMPANRLLRNAWAAFKTRRNVKEHTA